jgi:hypothetical protein
LLVVALGLLLLGISELVTWATYDEGISRVRAGQALDAAGYVCVAVGALLAALRGSR